MRLTLPLLLSFASVGCQDYLFEQKCPERISEQTLARSVAKPKPSDILFIVDDSGSMADEQERLAANFDAFINTVSAIDQDYRIGVITTDLDNATNRTGKRSYRYTEMSTYKNVYSSDESGCVDSMIPRACLRGPDSSKRLIDSTTMTPNEQILAFNNNVQVGSCGDGDEKGLEAALLALEGDKACNDGLGRDNANLVLVFVSDEEDTSSGDVASFVDRLEALRPITDVRVAVVVGYDGNEAANCVNAGTTCGTLCDAGPPPPGTGNVCTNNAGCMPEVEYCDRRRGDPTGTCESLAELFWSPTNCTSCSYFDVDDCCSAQAGTRYVAFAREVEMRIATASVGISAQDCQPAEGDRTACLLDSVCQDDFSDTLARIARDLVVPTDYDLDPAPPNPDGVTARLTGGRFGDGVELILGEDFTISSDGTTLRLDPEKAPQDDETLDIAYVVEVIDAADEPRGACGI